MSRSLTRWINDPVKFVHHPLCDNFTSHVFVIRGHKLCRGCTMFYPSLAVSIILSFLLGIYQWDAIPLGIMMTVLLIPTILSFFFSFPRPVRDINKSILGLDSGVGVIVVLFHPQLWVKVVVIMVAIPSIVILEKIRGQRDLATCKKCPEYSRRKDLECSGFNVVGNRIKVADIMVQSVIPDPLQNTSTVTSFEDL